MSDLAAALRWTPLELWRASTLPADTQRVTGLYDAALASGDASRLNALRAEIESRIDALDSFYIVNMDDNRAKLFKKQKFKLRKLLHKTAASVGRAGALAPATPSAVSSTARLTLAQLLVWHLSTGMRELPWVTEDLVQRVFKQHAAGTKDGRMSLAEFRAAAARLAPRSVGSPASSTGAAGTGAGAAAGAGGGAGAGSGRRPRATGRQDRDDAGSVSSLGTSSVGTRSTRRRRKPKAIYAWEQHGDDEDEEEDEDEDDVDLDALVELKGGIAEFQIRMTAAEYAAYACRRRARAAEKKHMQRTARTAPPKPDHVATVSQTGPYVEPSTLENYFYRNDKREKWITRTGFQRSPAPIQGVRPTVATVRRALA